MRVGKNTLIFAVEIVIALALFIVLQFFLSPFDAMSIFPSAFLLMMMGVGVLMYLTRMHMGGYTMMDAIKEKNIAYAVIVLAFAIVISGALSL